MPNVFDSVEYFRFEPGALGIGSRGAFNFNNNNVAEETVSFREGLGCAKFTDTDSSYFWQIDGELPGDFPFKNLTQNKIITISLWFYCDKYSTSRQYIFWKGSNAGIYYTASDSGGTLYLNTGTAAARALYNNVAINTWHHFTLCYNCDNGNFICRLYSISPNSTRIRWGTIREGTTRRWNPNSDQVVIGSNAGTTNYFNGYMDELSIWGKILTIDEARQVQEQVYPNEIENRRATSIVGADPTCIALYKFDDARFPGTDSKGTNHLYKAFSGRPFYGIDPYPLDYKVGSQSCSLNPNSAGMRISDYVLSDNFPLHSNGNNKKLSITGWFKTATVTGEKNLIGKGMRTSAADPEYYRYGWRAWTDGSSLKFDIQYGTYNQSTEVVTLFTGIQTGRWYHLSLTYDVDSKTYYAELWDDTASTKSTAGPAATTNTTNILQAPFWVGAYPERNTSQYNWNGLIDEIAVFNDIITPSEMQSIRDNEYDFMNDQNCVGYYIFENDRRMGWDSKELNHLFIQGSPVADPIVERMEGYRSLSGSTSSIDNANLQVAEKYMSTSFPFNSLGTGTDMGACFFMYQRSLPSASSYQYIVGKGSFYAGDPRTWALRIRNPSPLHQIQLVTYYNTGTTEQVTVLYEQATFDINRWYFVGLSLNGTTGEYAFYLYDVATETVLVSTSGILANPPSPVAGNFAIAGASDQNGGVSSFPGLQFDGWIDEAAIFNAYKPVEFYESVVKGLPLLEVETYLDVRARLYSLVQLIDPAEDDVFCGLPACHPDVAVIMTEYPVADMRESDTVVAGVLMNDIPSVELECKTK